MAATTKPALRQSATGRYLRLSVLGPLVICAGLTLDVSLRFFPIEYFTFRAHDYAVLFSTAEGPYAPNLSYDNSRAYGDLANLGNLRKSRVYRREVFTTDPEGFRVTPGTPAKPVSLVVAGDSFAGGAALSDDETLSAQLSTQGQIRAFNGAGTIANWTAAARLIKRLGMKNGVLLWELSERHELPLTMEPVQGAKIRLVQRFLPPDSAGFRRFRSAYRFAEGHMQYSPLRVLAKSFFDRIQNDEILPNAAALAVARRTLTNGQSMLFLPSELDNFGKTRPAEPGPFIELQELVQATGNELLVVLVPDKYNVYYSRLASSPPAPADEKLFLSTVARNLEAARVPVLNLTPALRDEAAKAYQRGEYCFHSDDTHWNASGARRAASEILKRLGHPAIPDSLDRHGVEK